MKGLFLDDERFPNDVCWLTYPTDIEWTIVRSVEEFLEAINAGPSFSVISFDHDLGEDVPTGYDAVKSLCEIYESDHSITIPVKMFFHTKNPVGGVNMCQYWNNYVDHWTKTRSA